FRNLAKPIHFESSHSDLRAEQVPGSITMDLGNLKMDNVVGPVKFRTGSRDIDIANVSNSIELNVDRGDIQVSESKAPLPKMDIQTRSGDLTITLPEGAPFQLEGHTGSGEVQNDYGSALETKSDGRSASVKGKTGNGPQLSLVTDRGVLTIRKK